MFLFVNLITTETKLFTIIFQYEDTFEDHLEMLVQFGYVTLFSSAFPMAAMCALLNNVIEIRSDAFKLCMTFQRPFGQQVQSIGTWQVLTICLFTSYILCFKQYVVISIQACTFSENL